MCVNDWCGSRQVPSLSWEVGWWNWLVRILLVIRKNQSSMCVRVFELSDPWVSALTHSDRPDLHKNISKPLSLLVARVNPSVKDKEVPHSTMKITLFYKILWLNLTKDSLFKAWDDLWFLHSKWQIIFNSLIKTHLEQNQIDVIQLRSVCTFPYLPKNTSDQPTGLTVRLAGASVDTNLSQQRHHGRIPILLISLLPTSPTNTQFKCFIGI